uniref:ATP-dependent DNA helicase n=1 Tax=Anopheles epiroticus TaxID=199890 RepID=A0A182PFC9_9DIPT
MEAQRLLFQRNNQSQLRAELYQGVWDIAASDEEDSSHVNAQTSEQVSCSNTTSTTTTTTSICPRSTLQSIGRRVILSPSFVGSDRYMTAQYQDSMAIVRAFGKPDLFITITCNPKWPEIIENLLPGQHTHDRPDLTARVFHLKLKAILDDLHKGALGVEVAKVYMIEFQQCGLPHAHLLLILGDDDKPQTPDDYNKFVSAEIPDPANTRLYHTVTRFMMHGPCGTRNRKSPCMKDGVCTKHYPKSFSEHTHVTENGYPGYRRRNDGRTVTVKGVALDNRHVVPYNPWLCHKFDCHINVEISAFISGVKYLYKNVYKGNDRAAISLGSTADEITNYLDARYISAAESCWRIMRFEIQAKSHTVGKIALATATSGIASLLLTGGKTVHSTFKLPLDLDDRSNCAIPKQSKLAELIRESTLIVWDEASMASRYALEAVDRTLQDLIGVRRPFGGKVVLLSGDFRQILPTVPNGTAAQIINQCIKRSPLWQLFTQLRLRINMRVCTATDRSHASDLQEFADFLLKIGEGRHDIFPGLDPCFAKVPVGLVLPRTNQLQSSMRLLIDKVYPKLKRFYRDAIFFTDRAILSPFNDDVTTINNVVLDSIPEPVMEYRSYDTLVNSEEQENMQLSSEFLNSLNISGIPLHRLCVKRYAPVLLLRNLNTDIGLCNGTRLQIVDMKRNCIHARILTGKRQGDDVLLPRIYCDSNDKDLPFQIRRKQFPVQLCFAMTINKSQGQSLNHLGIYLPKHVFAHGQLYVGLSRVTSKRNMTILIGKPEREDNQGVSIKNIVYKEVVEN